MKTPIILAIITILLSNHHTLAQLQNKKENKNHDEISQKIANINSQLKQYAALSPYTHDNNNPNRIDSIRQNITDQLLEILNNKQIIHYRIENLLDQNELYISKSNNSQLFFFSLDEKTGGSYRSNISIIHYRLPNGTVKASYFGDMIYNAVHILDSLNNKYLVVGQVQTCNTCISSSAEIITLHSNTCHSSQIAMFDGRFANLKVFDYDSLNKVFSFEYSEANNDDPLYSGNNEHSEFNQIVKRKFKYLNQTFIETESCVFLEEKEH